MVDIKDDDFWISPKYRASQWKALQLYPGPADETAWAKAADIVENRIKGRLVRWIDSMVDKKFSGFAVIALDCLLIETLVGFMTGNSSKGPDDFLTGKLTKGKLKLTDGDAWLFRNNVRNGIIHGAETKGRWLIRPGSANEPILTKQGKNTSLNRNSFHSAVTQELDGWLAEVRSGDKKLRNNMRLRMEQILEKHGKAVK